MQWAISALTLAQKLLDTHILEFGVPAKHRYLSPIFGM